MKLIDGSVGEGGGQVLRTSIGLSAALGIPVKVVNIRAKRKNPGLQRQHLVGVKAVAALCNAKVRGAELGSTELLFEPGRLRGGEVELDIGTAGSVTLVLQAVLPALPFLPEPARIVVRGGTDVPWSPTIDYVRGVLVPMLKKLGFELDVKLVRRGHYPRGGGLVVYEVKDPPGFLRSLAAPERGSLLHIEGVSHAVKLPEHVAARQARSAEEVFKKYAKGVEVSISLDADPAGSGALGPGSGIAVWAVCERSVLGADALGAPGKRAEVVGEEAAKKLVEDLESGAALDRHMSDMLVPLLALAKGESVVSGAKLTLHAITNIEVVKSLVDGVEILVEGDPEKPFKLLVKGVGLERKG